MEKIKVLITDDQSIIREGLKFIVEMEEDMEVVGLASNGEEALGLVEALKPDVVLMDIRMPVCDGVMGTRKIAERYPKVKILILTTFSDDNYIFEALKAGASGYLLKDVESEEIGNSIRTVYKGGMLISRDVAARVVNGLRNLDSNTVEAEGPKGNSNIAAELTQRELEIVKLVGLGKTNREISKELFLSEGTVKNHISSILSKLYLRDRTQIALYAAQNKLV